MTKAFDSNNHLDSYLSKMRGSSDYTLRHLAIHLYLAQEHRKLEMLLLSNRAWELVKFERLGDDQSYLDDLDLLVRDMTDPLSPPEVQLYAQVHMAREVIAHRFSAYGNKILETLTILGRAANACAIARLRPLTDDHFDALLCVYLTQKQLGENTTNLFNEILNVAQEIVDVDQTNSTWIIDKVAPLLVSERNTDESLSFANKVKDIWEHERVLLEIARTTIHADNIEKALQITESITSDDLLSLAQVEIAMELHKRKDVRGSILLEAAISGMGKLATDNGYKQDIAIKIVKMLNELRDPRMDSILKQMLSEAKAIREEYNRVPELEKIAILLASIGRIEEALDLIGGIWEDWRRGGVLVRFAEAAARMGKVELALSVIEDMENILKSRDPDPQTKAKVAVARVLTEQADHRARALIMSVLSRREQILARREHKSKTTIDDKWELYIDIAEVLAMLDEVEKAIAVAEQITDKNYAYLKSDCFAVIAKVLAKKADARAYDILVQAMNLAEQNPNPDTLSSPINQSGWSEKSQNQYYHSLDMCISALAKVNGDMSLTLIGSMEAGERRDRALQNAIEQFCNAGSFGHAISALKMFQSSDRCMESRYLLIQTLCDNGEINKAIELAKQGIPGYNLENLIRLFARSLAKKGRIKEAKDKIDYTFPRPYERNDAQIYAAIGLIEYGQIDEGIAMVKEVFERTKAIQVETLVDLFYVLRTVNVQLSEVVLHNAFSRASRLDDFLYLYTFIERANRAVYMGKVIDGAISTIEEEMKQYPDSWFPFESLERLIAIAANPIENCDDKIMNRILNLMQKKVDVLEIIRVQVHICGIFASISPQIARESLSKILANLKDMKVWYQGRTDEIWAEIAITFAILNDEYQCNEALSRVHDYQATCRAKDEIEKLILRRKGFTAAVQFHGFQNPNRLLESFARWVDDLELMQTNLSVELISETMRIAGWTNDKWRYVYHSPEYRQ